MPQISKLVRDAVKTLLADSSTGLNPRLAAGAGTYGVPSFEIDFSSGSTNFLFGRVAADLVEESSPLRYPLLTIDTVRTQHTSRVKFATFAGPVIAVIEVHQSWPGEGVIPDFASAVDAVEDAVIACLNDPAAAYPGNLLWNGQITGQKSPILMAGENWRQTIQFLCTFEVVA